MEEPQKRFLATLERDGMVRIVETGQSAAKALTYQTLDIFRCEIEKSHPEAAEEIMEKLRFDREAEFSN